MNLSVSGVVECIIKHYYILKNFDPPFEQIILFAVFAVFLIGVSAVEVVHTR